MENRLMTLLFTVSLMVIFMFFTFLLLSTQTSFLRELVLM